MDWCGWIPYCVLASLWLHDGYWNVPKVVWLKLVTGDWGNVWDDVCWRSPGKKRGEATQVAKKREGGIDPGPPRTGTCRGKTDSYYL